MKQALTLAACLAVVGGVAPWASAQFAPPGRPQFPYPGAFGPRPDGTAPRDQAVVPGPQFGTVGRPVNPQEERKDRDHGLGVISHIPHVLSPEFRPAPEPEREVR
jgi:hypothetical protein